MHRFAYRVSRRLRRAWLRLCYRHVWPKIAWRVMLAVNIPVVIMCVLLISSSRQAVRDSVLQNHIRIVSRVAYEIGDFVRTPDTILRSIAEYLSVSSPDPWGQESILVNQVLNYPLFLRITAFDKDGAAVASSDMRTDLCRLDPGCLASVMRERFYVSGIKDITQHSPYITIAVPIMAQGAVAGSLVGDINLRSLWQVMDRISLEKTGTVFIVGADGTLIAARDKKKVLTGADITAGEDVRRALSGRTGSMELRADGKQWISSFTYVPGPRWGVVLRQERLEALSFSYRMQRQSLLLLLFLELFVIAISVILARLLVGYLEQVIARLKSVAEGRLEDNLPRHRHDEFGTIFKSFNHMVRQLKKHKEMERFSTIGEAASCIAHEFKNSMIAMKSFVQLFPKRHDDPAFIEMFGELVPKEMQRWERMLKELSAFSSIDVMDKKEMLASEAIESVLTMLSGECERKGIAVVFLKKADVPLLADRERITQVVINITLNAIQAMPQGGRLEIVEDVERREQSYSGKYVSIRISDTGKGIPIEIMSSLFQPFQSSKSGSLGLGLIICRRIVENHNGTISVESRINEGTVFTIRLPLA